MADLPTQVVYWHRELPPIAANIVGEHTVEAVSSRIPGTIVHREELWDECRVQLMAQAGARVEQEVLRLGGKYAHVIAESITPRRDDVSGEAWLHGRFTYLLFR